MIKAKIKNKEYNIKSSWNDLTYQDYINIVNCKENIDAVSILSGIEVETLLKLDEQSLKNLSACISFIQELEQEEVLGCLNIREQTFGQKILLQEKLQIDNKEMIPAYALAIYEYNYEQLEESFLEVLKMSFRDVYNRGMNYVNQLSEILKSESIHLKSTPNSEQRRAGIDMFDEFGVMNTIDSLAGGDILKYEQILKIDYNTVFIKQKMLKFANQFQENYTKIMSNKR